MPSCCRALRLTPLQEGLHALMSTHFVATDLMHALFHSSAESQKEILGVLARMCGAGDEGVTTLLQCIEYFMYIDYEEFPLQKLVSSLSGRTAEAGLVRSVLAT